MFKNRNFLSFFISASLHVWALYWLFATAITGDTLLAKKNEAPKALAISLSQISPVNKNEDAAAVQDIAPAPPQPPTPPPAPKEPSVKPPEPKQSPKPTPKPAKKAVVTPPKETQKEAKEAKKENESEQKPAPTPVSQSAAHNDAVKSGGSVQSGESKSAERAQSVNLLGLIYEQILKHKTYPKKAVMAKAEGRAEVEFLLEGECKFSYLRIAKSSGSAFLDEHSLKILQKACGGFPSEAVGKEFKVSINFNLKQDKR